MKFSDPTVPGRQAPGMIPAEIRQAVQRGMWEMRGSDAHNQAVRAEAALRYFLAHSCAVGGGDRVAVNDGDEGGLTLAEILKRAAVDLGAIHKLYVVTDPWGASVEMPCIFSTAELQIWCSAPPARRSKRGDDDPTPEEGVERKAKANLVDLEAHAAFLRTLGILACVIDDGWRGGPDERDPQGEFTRRMHLMVAAPLASVLEHGDRRPFDALAQLASTSGVPSDEASCAAHLTPGQLAEMLRGATGGEIGGTLPANLAKSPEELVALAAEWRDAGYDRDIFEATGQRWMRRAPDEIEPLVEGAIYRGKLHVFLGGASTGKSTLLHELAVKVTMPLPAGAPPPGWCGLPIRRGEKPLIVRFFSGEDADDMIHDRQTMFAKGGIGPSNVAFPKGGANGLGGYLASMKGKKRGDPGVPDLIVIDPALTFLKGCESDAGDVGDALGELVEIAAGIGAAVIVAHHLQKNARPRSMQDIRAMVRGSQVWIDRPRIALGVLRSRGMTQIGVAKSNIRGVNDFEILATLARDPETLLHTAVQSKPSRGHADVEPGPRDASSADDLDQRILTELRRLVGEGTHVTVSGKRDELYRLASVALAGIARGAIRSRLTSMIDAGLVVREDGGGLRPADEGEAPLLAAE